MKNKVLFFYIHLSGHKIAAEAIQKAISERYNDIETDNFEALAYAYPVAGRVISKLYLELLKYTPQIWDFLYDNKKVVSATNELREVLNSFNTIKLNKLIKQHSPSCLVCTQAVPCSVIAAAKRSGRINLPLVGVITDYAVHSYWIYKEVDVYLVATDAIKREMIKRGIKENKIYVTGIPIDPAFSKIYNKYDERSKLGLKQNSGTVLLMGGSLGLLTMDVIISRLSAINKNIQILAVTGQNKKLNKELHNLFGDSENIHIYSYTSQIPRLMAASDILISKPGGLTTSEALSQGLPIIIYQPIPGQEERNARFLISKGVAIKAQNADDLTDACSKLLGNISDLKELSRKCLQIAKPNASHIAAEIIYNLTKY